LNVRRALNQVSAINVYKAACSTVSKPSRRIVDPCLLLVIIAYLARPYLPCLLHPAYSVLLTRLRSTHERHHYYPSASDTIVTPYSLIAHRPSVPRHAVVISISTRHRIASRHRQLFPSLVHGPRTRVIPISHTKNTKHLLTPYLLTPYTIYHRHLPRPSPRLLIPPSSSHSIYRHHASTFKAAQYPTINTHTYDFNVHLYKPKREETTRRGTRRRRGGGYIRRMMKMKKRKIGPTG